MSSYYDIDAILADEELIPCTSLFDFNLLAALDPDGTSHCPHDKTEQRTDGESAPNERRALTYLPENSRIKVPLYAIEKWAMLGFVRLQLPRHFGRKARERYEADPGDADLRKRNERFFLAGQRLVNLIESSSTVVAKALTSMPRWRNARRLAHTQALKQLSEEARDLRRTLLKTYAGERLRKNFDWSQSSGGADDDVSIYLNKLTEMERRLYYTGASAVTDLEEWKLIGNRLLLMGPANVNNRNNMMTPMPKDDRSETDRSGNKRSVTPGEEEQPLGQRRRLE